MTAILSASADYTKYSFESQLLLEIIGDRKSIHVAPIRLKAVNLCALSAHTRPLTSSLSNVVTCASLALSAAALNLLTFSCGVSPGGPGVLAGFVPLFIFAADGGGLVWAWGVVEVNLVASVAERGIMRSIDCFHGGKTIGKRPRMLVDVDFDVENHISAHLMTSRIFALLSANGRTRIICWELRWSTPPMKIPVQCNCLFCALSDFYSMQLVRQLFLRVSRMSRAAHSNWNSIPSARRRHSQVQISLPLSTTPI